MGVTVHFYALVEGQLQEENLSIETLLKGGFINDSLQVLPEYRDWLTEIESHMGDNKKWYQNIEACHIYTQARRHLNSKDQEAFDTYLSLFFWDPSEDPEPRQLPQAQKVSETGWLYSPALIELILELSKQDLSPLREAILRAQKETPTACEEAFWDPDQFLWWISVWLKIFVKSRALGSDRALLMWVWI